MTMEKTWVEAEHRVSIKHELKRRGISYNKTDATDILESKLDGEKEMSKMSELDIMVKNGDMLEKDFTYDTKNGWGGICSHIIAWVNFSCPYCMKYHSENFLFVPEIGKTEYIGTCKNCDRSLRIKINILTNNALVKQQELNLRRIEGNGNESLLKWAIE
jgi:hypothetical protein